MPEGAEILNVNFPPRVQPTTPLVLTHVGKRKYTDKVFVRKDPRGRPYYWLFGEKLSHFPAETDIEAVATEEKVSISPLVLRMSGPITEPLNEFRNRVQNRLRSPIHSKPPEVR